MNCRHIAPNRDAADSTMCTEAPSIRPRATASLYEAKSSCAYAHFKHWTNVIDWTNDFDDREQLLELDDSEHLPYVRRCYEDADGAAGSAVASAGCPRICRLFVIGPRIYHDSDEPPIDQVGKGDQNQLGSALTDGLWNAIALLRHNAPRCATSERKGSARCDLVAGRPTPCRIALRVGRQ